MCACKNALAHAIVSSRVVLSTWRGIVTSEIALSTRTRMNLLCELTLLRRGVPRFKAAAAAYNNFRTSGITLRQTHRHSVAAVLATGANRTSARHSRHLYRLSERANEFSLGGRAVHRAFACCNLTESRSSAMRLRSPRVLSISIAISRYNFNLRI